MRLDELPHLELAHLPTPLEEAHRLAAAIGGPDGPRLFVKRDDLTGLGLGGNKARKLEYLLAAAGAEGADCVITIGALQSNHCRITAAAAARLGLDCYLVLTPPFVGEGQGSALLDALLGARLVRVESRDPADVQDRVDRLIEELRSVGRRPYLIPVGGSNPLGAAGYVRAMRELAEQCRQLGIRPTHVVHASGSAGTQAGVEVGCRACLPETRVLGVAVSRPAAQLAANVAQLAQATADFLQLSQTIQAEAIEIDDRHYGSAYGELTDGAVEAMALAARHAGICLDPVYSAKALAGLIAGVREGRLTRADTVVFIHTGGIPALFAYNEGILARLPAP